MTPRSCLLEPVAVAPPETAGAGRVCVYSQTRRRFICADVEAGDFSNSSLDIRLLGLGPDAAKGIWLIPFWGIPPTSLSVPVDLICLDQDCVVLETVESFPLSQVSGSTPPPASVLVLPADSVSSTGTEIGDRLVICIPDEMKRRLKDLSGAESKARPDKTDSDDSSQHSDHLVTARVLRWEGHGCGKSIHEEVSTELSPRKSSPTDSSLVGTGLFGEPSIQQPLPIPEPRESAAAAEPSAVPPVQADVPAGSGDTENSFELFKSFMPAPAESTSTKSKSAKNWLKRFFAVAPTDQRRSDRESIKGLVAYFFTGGSPVPHEVRDISPTGAYIYTQERWYPGTIVRLTLADNRVPDSERNMTLNSAVVRTGADGVGLHFEFDNQRNYVQQCEGADKQHVERFIQRLREGASSTG